MEKKATRQTTFNRLDNHVEKCKAESENVNPSHSWNYSDTFCNLKVEIFNSKVSSQRKRRLDDSCLDDSYETPLKKLCSLKKAISPDQACVIDSCDSISDLGSSLSAFSGKKILRKGKDQVSAVGLSTKDTKYVDSGHIQESAYRKNSTAPNSAPDSIQADLKRPEVHPEKFIPVFDCDIDDILCLSPIESDSDLDEGIDDLITSCQSHRKPGQKLQYPVLCQSQIQEKVKEDGDIDALDKKRKPDRLRDESYFSKSYLQAQSAGTVALAFAPLQLYTSLPAGQLCPLVNSREVLLANGDKPCSPVYNGNQAVMCQQQLSFTFEDCSQGLSEAPLNPVEGVGDCLDGTCGEGWNIGAPMLQSSVCHSAYENAYSVDEESGVGKGEVEGGVQNFQGKLEKDKVTVETSCETSYETTLPLQVQVRSVVVVPPSNCKSTKTPTPPEPQLKVPNPSPSEQEVRKPSSKCIKNTIQRPVIFDSEEKWRREKKIYVESVTRHVKENTGGGQDVMTELLNLMTHVADQGSGANGRQWQHPSDFTRRNYQIRVGTVTQSLQSLDEWQNQNHQGHRRFAKVPRVFKRSPFL